MERESRRRRGGREVELGGGRDDRVRDIQLCPGLFRGNIEEQRETRNTRSTQPYRT
jgi:hypothetical protein